MTYSELKRIFCDLKRNYDYLDDDLTAHIVMTEESFGKGWSRLERTFSVCSYSLGFQPHMAGGDITAFSLDGKHGHFDLRRKLVEEGAAPGWKVETCYILEFMQDVVDMSPFNYKFHDDGTVTYSFGSTTIRAKQFSQDGVVCLEPVSGEQVVNGERVDLKLDVVAGYCAIQSRHLNIEDGFKLPRCMTEKEGKK